jgi:heat shock protein HslJ
VPDPERHTVIFRPDGSANLQADCNFVNVSYTVDGSELVFDMFGPTTLAFCGEDSLDQQFLALLGQVATFTLADGRLKLGLANEAGVMGFDSGGPAEEPVIDEQPEEAATDIVGVTWLWAAFKDQAGENDIDVPSPESYSLTLMPDGTASIQTDCNMVSWTYTLESSSLTFNTLGPSTLAFCGEESLDQQYLALLGNTATYVTDEGNLVLNLMADAGNMIFSPAAEGSGVEAADESQITDVSWMWQSFADQAEENNIRVPTPHDYTLTLLPDGTASIKADCNMVSWTYTLEGNSLTFNTLGPSTLAFCGEEAIPLLTSLMRAI